MRVKIKETAGTDSAGDITVTYFCAKVRGVAIQVGRIVRERERERRKREREKREKTTVTKLLPYPKQSYTEQKKSAERGDGHSLLFLEWGVWKRFFYACV